LFSKWTAIRYIQWTNGQNLTKRDNWKDGPEVAISSRLMCGGQIRIKWKNGFSVIMINIQMCFVIFVFRNKEMPFSYACMSSLLLSEKSLTCFATFIMKIMIFVTWNETTVQSSVNRYKKAGRMKYILR